VLTGVRLPLAIAFPFADVGWRLALVIIAGLSDALDGIAARRLRATTWWGALLDASLDKLFTITVLVVLCWDGRLQPWEVGLLLVRDLAVLIAIVCAYLRGQVQRIREAAARPLGKATTVALFVLFALVLLQPARGALQLAALWLAIAMSVAAGIDYLIQATESLRPTKSLR
jgi:phosphatidylglycerophosphate synthase